MTKLIIQITKVIVTIISVLLLQSCVNSNWNNETISGNGKIVEVNRTVTENFNAISAKNGLEVIINQDNTNKIIVEADENLQDHIFTEVKEGTLVIYSDVNILDSQAKKIYVSTSNLNKLSSSSGASVTSEKELNFENLEVKSSSGSSINIDVVANTLSCESSSGSTLIAKGKTKSLNTKSSSGSSINLEKLIAENGQSNASSGSTTRVNVTNELKADASSGSSINYISKPNSLIMEESSGGSVHSR